MHLAFPLWRVALGIALLTGGFLPTTASQAATVAADTLGFCTPASLDAIGVLGTSAGSFPIYATSKGRLFHMDSAADPVWVRERGAGTGLTAIAPDPRGEHTVLYTRGGGVYLSAEGGARVHLLAQDPGITSIVRARSNPDTLYALGKAAGSDHIFRSTDDGRTWSSVYDSGQGAHNIDLSSLQVDGRNASHLAAVRLGYHDGTILQSTDGGAAWQELPGPPGSLNDLVLPDRVAMNPADGTDLWATYAPAGGNTTQLEHSHDGGQSWSTAGAGLPSGSYVSALAIDGRSGAVYAALSGGMPSTLYVAPDGAHFRPLLPAGATATGITSLELLAGGTLLLPQSYAQSLLIRLLPTGARGTLVPIRVRTTAITPKASSDPTTLIQAASEGYLYGRDPRSGAMLWEQTTSGPIQADRLSGVYDDRPLQVYGGSVYAEANCLYAIDARTGANRWSVPKVYDVRIAGSTVYGRDDAADRSAIVALDTATGRQRWRAAPFNGSSGAEQLAVAGSMVYTLGDDPAASYKERTSLVALDARTGAVAWRFQFGESTPAASDLALTVRGGIVYVHGHTAFIPEDAVIYAVDARTGTRLWRDPATGLADVEGSIPWSVASGLVYLSAKSTTPHEDYTALTARDARTGAVRWTARIPGDVPGGLVAAGQVLLTNDVKGKDGTYDHRLVALDAATGAQRWVATLPGTSSGIRVERGLAVLIGDLSKPPHDLWLAALDSSTGTPRWSVVPPRSYRLSSDHVLVTGAQLFLKGYDANVHAFDLATGQQQWQGSGSSDYWTVETPADTAPTPLPIGAIAVPATRHSVAPPFVATYAMPARQLVLGFPVTEAYSETGVLTQDFEHLRLELRGVTVAIAPLGSSLCALHCPAGVQAAVPATPDTPTSRFFSQTGHTLAGDLLHYWTSHGGEAVLGAPITEVFRAPNGDGSGRSYEMQYFQNARLERHPETHDSRYAVLLGLLGRESVMDRGWDTSS